MIGLFFRKLFSKRNRIEETEPFEYDDLVLGREDVDFYVEEERTRYITDYLERLKEILSELNLLEGEYDQVTGYLSDLETLADLPKEEKEAMGSIVSTLLSVEKDYRVLLDRKDRMEDEVYYSIRSRVKEVREAIGKINEAEDLAKRIRQDLKRLDKEKHAYLYRRRELEKILANLKGMTFIFMGAFVVCILLLLGMQFVLEMNAMAGFFVAVLVFSVAMTVLAVKYMDMDQEYGKLLLAVKRLTRVTNTVKIRYVNNTNLLNYYYLKYHTDSGKKLARDYEQYQKEVEARRQFSTLESQKEELHSRLLSRLCSYPLRFPKRLAMRPECILDHKEQVEQRHSLILRRQALRKQMEYNKNIKESIEEELKQIAEMHSAYREEIIEMAGKYGVKIFIK